MWGLFGFHLYCNELPSDPCRNFLWWFVYGLYSVQSPHGSLIGLMIVVMFSFGWFFILCETTNKVQCLGLLIFLYWFYHGSHRFCACCCHHWLHCDIFLILMKTVQAFHFSIIPFFLFFGCEVLFYEWCSIENNELLILVEGLEDFELFTFFFCTSHILLWLYMKHQACNPSMGRPFL